MTITITSLNTRSMLRLEKRATVFRHLSTQPADIYLLQECAIPYKEMDALLEGEWTRGDSLWSGSNTARADGVGMLVANPFLRQTSHRVVESGRILAVDLEVRGSPLRVINIYGPTNVAERVSLYAKLRPLLMTPLPMIDLQTYNTVTALFYSNWGLEW